MNRYWTHKKHKKKSFIGKYERDSHGERVLVLVEFNTSSKPRRITFESWQLAKEAGWVLIRETC